MENSLAPGKNVNTRGSGLLFVTESMVFIGMIAPFKKINKKSSVKVSDNNINYNYND